MRADAGRRVVAGAVALTLAGCANLEAIRVKNREFYSMPYTEEVALVAPHVRPEHFAKCRQILGAEPRTDLFGRVWTLSNTFKLSVKSTCAARGHPVVWRQHARVAAYLTVRETSGNGSGPTRVFVGCIMALKDGVVTVHDEAPLRAPATSPCHRLKEF